MKKLSALLFFVLACGPQIDLTERPRFANGVNTLTFMLYDAFTGEPITGAENASVVINIGTYAIQAPTPAEGNVFVVSQVPQGTHLTTVTADGYVGFLGQASATGSGTLTGPNSQNFVRPYQVGLYPIGSVTADARVRVFEASTGAPVPTGNVVATLTADNSVVDFDNPLPGTLAVRPTTLVVALDSTGTAVLSKDNLVLGGRYQIEIYGAKNTDGDFLAPPPAVTMDVGRTFEQVTLFLGPPSQRPIALSANNENLSGTATIDRLTVTFPYPVEVCSEDNGDNWFALGNFDRNADGIVVSPAASNPVTASVAPNNLGSILTVSPNFSTNPQTLDGYLDIYFVGVQIRVEGAAECIGLDNIRLRGTSGPFVSTVIPRIR